MRRPIAIAIAAGFAVIAAGCGESTDVTVYKQGRYQGKPDMQPWNNAQFNNDRAAWEKAIKARTDGQNEYSRLVAR